MSTLRNIAAHLWRGSIVRKANVILGITGAALSAACAADQVVAPTHASPHALSATDQTFDADGDGHLSKSEKAAKDSVKQYNKAQLDSLKRDWQAFKRAVQSGEIEADLLSCEPKPEVSVTKVIGPKGGAFNIGPHKFEVPAGALDSNVTITAVAPTTTRDELQFYPHGLQFNKPVQMTMNYKGCVIPQNAVLNVSYVAHALSSPAALTARTTERLPTNDDKPASAVTALTDHFSGYIVGWGRQ